MPRVSVIIPTFNPGTFLQEAVESVIAQTFRDWEIVIVDDGSTEDLRKVAELHPSIRYIRQKNAGVSAARNRGIAVSTGEYIALLDADDIWKPAKLMRQVELMDSDAAAGLCHTGFQTMDAAGRTVGSEQGHGVASYTELLKDSTILTSTVMMRRSHVTTVGKFDVSLCSSEDYDFYLRLLKRSASVFVPGIQVLYRSHPNSLSTAPGRMYRQSIQVLRRHYNEAISEKDDTAAQAAREGMDKLRRSYGCMYFDQSRQSLRAGKIGRSLRLLLGAIRLQPAYTIGSIRSYTMTVLRRPFQRRTVLK